MKLYATVLLAAATFHDDVLPLLQRHCQFCHRPGQIAPMPLITYRNSRPWAKAIREAVLSRKMPPWFADPTFGKFVNNPSLSNAEIQTIANWVDNGAPEGNVSGGPAAPAFGSEWQIGKPDRIVGMTKPVLVPATATIEYQYVILAGGFEQDTWLQAVEVRPGNPALVHHAVVYAREPGSKWLSGKPRGVPFQLTASPEGVPNPASFTTSDILMVYAPGHDYDRWPDGMAKRIKAGSDIVIQIHYTSNGKAGTDRSQVGLNFATQAPQQAVLTLQMGNDKFVIPAGEANYRVPVSGTLPNQALLLSMYPHMHLRGKAFEMSLPGEDGRVETLLKINHYDFRWQLSYKLEKPRLLAPGTRISCVGYFDNSPNNPLNPNPSVDVSFGEQIWQEMMIGFFDVAVDARFDKQSFFASRPMN